MGVSRRARVGSKAKSAAPLLRDVAILTFVYAALGWLSLEASVTLGSVAPVWPAAGLALAVLLARGLRLWPGIFLGGLLLEAAQITQAIGSLSNALVAGMVMAGGATISALLGAWLIERQLGTRTPFRTVRGLLGFVAVAVVSPLFSATTGAAGLVATGFVNEGFTNAWATWWLGDTTGILVVAPAVLVVMLPRRWCAPSRSRLEAALLALAFIAVGALAFGPFAEVTRQYPLAHLALPLLVWAALRFGVPGAVSGNLFIAVIAVAWTAHDFGPFSVGSPLESLRLVQVFVGMIAVTFLSLAAVLEERGEAQREIALGRALLADRVEERTSALQQANSLLVATLEATADGLLVVNRSRRIASFNSRFVELFEIPEEVLATGRDHLLLDEVLSRFEDPERFRSRVEELYGHPEWESEDSLRLRDGRIIERYSRPQWIGGDVVGRVWSFRDVTATVRAEAERDQLLEAEKHARRAAEQSNRRSAFLAEAGRRLVQTLEFESTLREVVLLPLLDDAEWAALHLLEPAGPQLVALAWSTPAGPIPWLRAQAGAPIPGPDPQGLLPFVEEALESEDPVEVEAWRDGGMLLRELRFFPLVMHGRQLGVLGVARTSLAGAPTDPEMYRLLADRAAVAIENAWLYREAQQAIRIRDDFLSIASHELKTPLTTLKLQLQRMSRLLGSAGPELQPLVGTVVRQTNRLHSLIDNLLDISRITSHSLALEFETVDLAAVVRDAVERVREDCARAGTEVVLSVKGDLTGIWDRIRVEQVVGNLLSNAIKYGSGRPVEISVEGEGDQARFSVTDHGIGISDEDQARIFERFERAVASRHYGGFGLGLWIVRQVVEALGGRISVRSRAGEGSTFTVELPRIREAAEEAMVH